jgi:hypothetical protein
MLPFGQLKNEVARKLSVPVGGDYANTQIRDFLQRRYRHLWDIQNWPATLELVTVTVAANANFFVLPKRYETALALLNNTSRGDTNDFSLVEFARRNLQDTTDTWPAVSELAPMQTFGVEVQPAATSVITVLSSSSSDTSKQIFVRGLSGGEVRTEVITTNASNGTTTVNGSISFTEIQAVSKLSVPTAGVITIKAGSTVLGTIAPAETSPQYKRYRVTPTGATAQTLTVVAKRRFVPFANNADVAVVDMDAALIHGATADGWMEHRQYDMAQSEESAFMQAYDQLVARELNLAGHVETWGPVGRF